MIDTKDIIRMALVSANSKVILIHPSKNLKPSEHDLNISNKLNKMLKCFNICKTYDKNIACNQRRL